MAVEIQSHTYLNTHVNTHPQGKRNACERGRAWGNYSRVSLETASEGASEGRGNTSVCPSGTNTLTIFLLLSAMCSSVSISTSLLREVFSSRSSINSGSCKRGEGPYSSSAFIHHQERGMIQGKRKREKEELWGDGNGRDLARTAPPFRDKFQPTAPEMRLYTVNTHFFLYSFVSFYLMHLLSLSSL